MSAKTLPDQITDLLIAFVFIGKLVPGDKLPPERQLAEYLGVDRTSLRMALRTLTRMNIVHTLQGSGIRVLDYKVDGGLDFLGNLYQINELELGGEFLLSGLELFNRAIPSAIKMSVEKSAEESQGKILGIVHKMYQGVQNGDDYRELARLDVELVDTLLASTNNIFMQVAGGSSRKIRQALTEKCYELMKEHAIQQLPIIADNKLHLKGMITRHDILKYLVNELESSSENFLKEINNISSKKVITTDPISDIRRVSQVMLDFNLNAIPVVNSDDILVGIVSRNDIIKAVASQPHLQLWA